MKVIQRIKFAASALFMATLCACAAGYDQPDVQTANLDPVMEASTSAPLYRAQWASYSLEQKAKGREMYFAVCVSCHGRNLEGATGYRLSDTQWVHGSSFEQVMASIRTGFPEKGMPGLEGVYADQDIAALTAFVLSQQGGWLDHEYEIWALPGGVVPFDPEWFNNTPIDKGAMTQPIPTFVKPEISEYAMRVSGDILIPEGEPAFVYVQGWRLPVTVKLNGEALQPAEDVGGPLYRVPAGQHHLSLTYTTVDSHPRYKGQPLPIFVTNELAKVRRFALTMGAQRVLEKTTIKFLAVDRPLVVRRRIVDIPARSIAVGFPDQYNFAFNPITCSLVAAWQGEFLDIGPNAIDRGNFGAIALGDLRFKAPDAIGLGGGDEASCDYIKMTRDHPGAAPSFHFEREGIAYTMHSDVGLYGLEIALSRDDAQGAPVAIAMPGKLAGISIDQSASDIARIVIE